MREVNCSQPWGVYVVVCRDTSFEYDKTSLISKCSDKESAECQNFCQNIRMVSGYETDWISVLEIQNHWSIQDALASQATA